MGNSAKIGAGVELDGEKEFKHAIASINKDLNVLASEMKMVASEFDKNDNSVESLTRKNEVLSKEYETQKKKVEATSEALKNSQRMYEQSGQKIEELKSSLESAKAKMSEMENSTETTTEELEKQQQEIDKITDDLGKAENAYSKNENKIKDWQIKLNNATTNLNKLDTEIKENEKRMGEAESATEDTKEATEEFTKEVEEAKKGTLDFGDVLLANLASDVITNGINKMASSIVGLVNDAVGFANEGKKAMNQFASSTGTAKEDLEGFNDVMHNIYKNNFGDSLEDVANVMAEVKRQVNEIDPSGMEEYARNAIILRDTFGYDSQESIRAVNMLVEQFGISADEAFNLIAQGAQKGLDKNGDLLDSINEYSVHYKQLGLDAEDMFNSLKNGAEAGTFSIDKLGDATKEFGIRVKDGTADNAFRTLKLDVEATKEAFNAGGDAAQQALETVTSRLFSMEDKVEQNTLGVEMFGTMWEDLGIEGVRALTDLNGEIKSTTAAMEEINSIRYDDLDSAIEGISRSLQEKFATPFENTMINATGSLNGLTAEINNGELGESLDKIGVELAELTNDVIDFATDAMPVAINALSWIIDNRDIIISGLMGVGAGFLTIKAGKSIDDAIDKLKDLKVNVSDAGGLIKYLSTTVATTSPWTVAAIAIGGAVTALSLLNIKTDESTLKAQELRNESVKLATDINDLAEEVDNLRQSREEDVKNITNQYDSYQLMSDRLYDLAEKENKTNAEKQTMAALVNQLNEALPELNLVLDEETGTLSKQREEVQQLIESNKNLYIVKSLESSYQEIANKETEATRNKIEAQEKLKEIQEEIIDAENRYNEVASRKIVSETELEIATKEYTDQMDLLKSAQEECNKTIDKSDKVLGECKGEWELNQKVIAECTDKMGDAENSVESLQNKSDKASKDMVQDAKKVSEEYQQAVDDRAKEIQNAVGLFDKFEKASDVTGKKLLSNLKSQVDGLRDWADNFQSLAKKGINEGLLKELEEMGPSAAAEIQALNNMTDKELEEYCKLWREKTKIASDTAEEQAESTKEKVVETTKEATKGVINEVEKSSSKAKDAGEKVAKSTKEGLKSQDFEGAGKNVVDGFTSGIDKNMNAAAQSAASMAKMALDAAKKKLDIHSPSRKFENEVGKMIAEGTAEGVKKNSKKAETATENMVSSLLDKAKIWLDNYKVYNEVSLTEELAFWKALQSKYKKGTEERIEIDKNYFEVKKQITGQLKEVEEDYQTKCKEVKDSLKSNIEELNQAYEEAVKNRANQITSQMNLFDEFNAQCEQSGVDLLNNLQSQVDGLNTWRETLITMKERIKDVDLFEYLQSLGPDALGELQSLNQLTDEQLNQYVQLWQEKNQIAKEQATFEMSDMKVATSKKIEELIKQANEEMDQYTAEYNKRVDELQKYVEVPMSKIVQISTKTGKKSAVQLVAGLETVKSEENQEKIGTINTTVNTKVGQLKKSLYKTGQNAIDGMISGIQSKTEELRSVMAEMCLITSQAADMQLDIHSPSRVFYKKGEYTVEGYELGIVEKMQNVIPNIKNAFSYALADTTPEMSMGMSTQIINNSSSVEQGVARANIINQEIVINTPVESLSTAARLFKRSQQEAMLEL
jgi:phage-related minor tail protein